MNLRLLCHTLLLPPDCLGSRLDQEHDISPVQLCPGEGGGEESGGRGGRERGEGHRRKSIIIMISTINYSIYDGKELNDASNYMYMYMHLYDGVSLRFSVR